jgi:hypothetical protein
VVGDHCDTATAEAVRRCKDPRLRFVNLAQRGLYPADPAKRWMVAGAQPMNAALFLAEGTWLAPCDDDDELLDDHVEVLLRRATSARAELVYSQATCEQPDGTWVPIGSEPLRWGGFTHGSLLYSTGLRFMLHSPSAWKLSWPGDWELMRRMQRVGVRIAYLPEVTYRHYAEARHRVSGA